MVQSPSWEANWFAASQEILRISRNPKVHYRTHKRPPLVPILGQHNPVHIHVPNFISLYILRGASPRNTPPPPENRVGEQFTSGLFYLQRKHHACMYFLTWMFYREGLLAPRPTPQLEDHPLSAVRDCLFNLFAATLHKGGRSSIRNLRTRHTVVTGTHYTVYKGALYLYLLQAARQWLDLRQRHEIFLFFNTYRPTPTSHSMGT